MNVNGAVVKRFGPWRGGVGVTPPVTSRKGGRGSSSKLVRLMVCETVLEFGSMTARVFEVFITDENAILIRRRSGLCPRVSSADGCQRRPRTHGKFSSCSHAVLFFVCGRRFDPFWRRARKFGHFKDPVLLSAMLGDRLSAQP